MSTETCKLCDKECTPWFHINGHICQDCYERDKWISVSDRLPDQDQTILCNVIGGGIVVAIYSPHIEEKRPVWIAIPMMLVGDNEDSVYCIKNVTHWMPLPLPPKE